MKLCSKCRRGSPDVVFGPNKASKDGVDFRCRACRAEDSREYRKKTPEKSREAAQRWRSENPEWRRAYNAHYYAENTAYHRARYAADPEHARALSTKWQKANPTKVRDSRMRARYGIEFADFERMIAAQEGRCLVCDEAARLVIDHNHETGAIRGLLCRNCNSGIGLLGDSVELLRRAIAYLNR